MKGLHYIEDDWPPQGKYLAPEFVEEVLIAIEEYLRKYAEFEQWLAEGFNAHDASPYADQS